MEQGKRVYQTRHHGRLVGELGGLCQDKNTATILAAVEELQKAGYRINESHVREGFAHVCELTGLRGRWQQVGEAPTVICDTGHNTGGMRYIAEQLDAAPAERLHIIIGMVNDKDVRGVLAMLPRRATYYFTKASVRRALDERELQQLAETAGLHGTCWPDVPLGFPGSHGFRFPERLGVRGRKHLHRGRLFRLLSAQTGIILQSSSSHVTFFRFFFCGKKVFFLICIINNLTFKSKVR